MSAMLELLISTLTEHFGMDEGSVTAQSRLDELEVDSLALLEMLTILEDEHGIPLPEEPANIQSHSTLADVAELLETTVASAASGVPAGVSGPSA